MGKRGGRLMIKKTMQVWRSLIKAIIFVIRKTPNTAKDEFVVQSNNLRSNKIQFFKKILIALIITAISGAFLVNIDAFAQKEYLVKSQAYQSNGQEFLISFNQSKSLTIQGANSYSSNGGKTVVIYDAITLNELSKFSFVVDEQRRFNTTIDLTQLKDGEYFFETWINYIFPNTFYFRVSNNQGYLISDAIQDNNRRFMDFIGQYNPADYKSTEGMATPEQAAEMKAFAEAVTITATTDRQKVKMIHDWITNNIYYDFECMSQCSQDAYSVYTRRTGVCAGYSRLFTFFLRSLEIPTLYVRGLASFSSTDDYELLVSQNNTNHAWNLVFLDGKWQIIDTTWNTGLSYDATNGYYVRYPPYWKYYNISSDFISKSHIFRFFPLPPSNFHPSDLSYNSVTLQWNKDEFAEGYQIISKADPTATRYTILREISDPNQTQTTISLFSNQKYLLGIMAYKTVNGEKIYSEATYINVTTPEYVRMESIKINPSVIYLSYIGETYQLNPIIHPDNTSDKNLKFSSWDTEVVKVSSEGVLTAVGFGAASVLVESYKYEALTWVTVYVTEPQPRFSDVPFDHRAYKQIEYLAEKGIINGYSDDTFRPNNTLTRAQAAIMIVRAAGISTEGVSSSFTDVPPTHASYKFISAAYQAGIINGYSDGTFRPNANVTRAQIAIIVQRAFNVQASETIITFTDVPEGYAPKKFIETLASQKIVNGYSDGTFKPLNNVTRAQFSTMIYNAIQYAQKQLAEIG